MGTLHEARLAYGRLKAALVAAGSPEQWDFREGSRSNGRAHALVRYAPGTYAIEGLLPVGASYLEAITSMTVAARLLEGLAEPSADGVQSE